MRAQLTILGCGSSEGVPRIDGFWGNCKKIIKKIQEVDVQLLLIRVKTQY